MLLCTGIILAMAALFCLSAKERLPEGCAPERWRAVFLRAAHYLLRKTGRLRGRKAVTPFETERLGGVLAVLFLGAGFSAVLQAAPPGKPALENGYELERPDSGQGDYIQDLRVQFADNAQTEEMEIVVAERRYTREEQEAFLEQAVNDLEQTILDGNPSADEVRGRVNLPQKLADGKVTAEWTQEPGGLLDEEGCVKDNLPEEGEVLQLKAVLVCGSSQRIYECALHLMPPLYSEEEKLRMALESEVQKADEDSAEKSRMILPGEVSGRKIVWQEPPTSVTGICLALTFAAAACFWTAKNRERRRFEETRRRQMIMDYPDLLFKLSMLLNAGLTMQNAFFRVALEYRSRRTPEIHYAYEEMLTSCYEMKSGVPEARAYENFGKRCGESGYNKLGLMLSTNLQKGSEGLAKILQELAAFAMEERRQMAKKLGEEAGTKLLVPMVLMLLVVLVILMAPAIMAF